MVLAHLGLVPVVPEDTVVQTLWHLRRQCGLLLELLELGNVDRQLVGRHNGCCEGVVSTSCTFCAASCLAVTILTYPFQTLSWVVKL